jgi:hypothetical protein
MNWNHDPKDEGPRPKKWQIKAKLTWHHFGRKINWLKPQKNLKFFKIS